MLQQLYPETAAGPRPLNGTYLELELHRRATPGDILIYANYIASLDGRIAVRDGDGNYRVPHDLANARDWRLYQELAAQSDVLITSGRYFRQLAANKAQDMLPIGMEAAYADVRAWRRAQGLPSQPAVAIISASLDIPEAALEQLHGRRILVLTTANADERRRKMLMRHDVEVIVAGKQEVGGGRLRKALIKQGFASAYMVAGPWVHRTLVMDQAIDLLFLTQRHLLLGGMDFSTLIAGLTGGSHRLRLLSLYYDEAGNQSFATFAYRA